MPTLLAASYSSTAARTNFKSVLDAAESGQVVTVQRDNRVSAVVAADRLREYFLKTVSARTTVLLEEGTWAVSMEGRPFVSEAATLEDAISDLVLSLREYAEDWHDRLQFAPNHANNWGLVTLIDLSVDEQILEWLEV